MKKISKRWVLAGLLVSLAFGFLSPGLPWSARCSHVRDRLMAKAEIRAYAWQGVSPKLISLSGKLVGREQPLIGAEIEALDSVSGWATLTNQDGGFVLPDIVWYPGAHYDLLVTANDYQERRLQVKAPMSYPESGIHDIGEIRFDRGHKIDGENIPGKSSVTYLDYDRENAEYYKELFGRLTDGKQTDEEKMTAATQYVAGRLITGVVVSNSETPRHLGEESSRRILESGSRYCGKLSLALATIARAGNYKARVINVIDAMIQPSAHMVAEIYYADQWHLFDPTIGGDLHHKPGTRTVSYKELSLATDAAALSPVSDHLPKIHNSDEAWLYRAYRSGFHHYYCFRD